MARIIYPLEFNHQRQLLTDINTKHVADGPASVIGPLLTQKGITLATDITAGTNAAVKEATRASKRRQAENYRQLRDKIWNEKKKHIRGIIQYLKSFYKPTVASLGDWGVNVSGNKINYPVVLADWITLLAAIKTKHDSYILPAVSPIAAYLTEHAIVLATDVTDLNDANTNDVNAQHADEAAETARQERDTIWDPVVKHLKDIGDGVMNLFSGSEKKAGNYGFTIDDSPRKPKVAITKIKLGQSKTITNVIVGGTLTNLGAGDIHVYKGKTTSGNPIIVHPGEMLGILKGFSTITVANPSTLIDAKFSVLRSA